MKTIKVFLASSDELADERKKFGNLIRQLDDIFLKQGIHLQLLVWEDMDPSYNNCRKQDEYNAWIRESQIFVALFYTRAGQYTMEEVEVAREENSLRNEPKMLIYCRNLQSGEKEEQTLVNFKQILERQMGHFWGNFGTTDKLHFDFVMHIMRSTVGRSDALKVENGQVLLDNFSIANMNNLPFASGNDGYQRMSAELDELNKEIKEIRSKQEKKQLKMEKKRIKLEQEPANEDNQEEYNEAKEELEEINSKLQKRLNRLNTLKDEFTRHQQALIDTAKRVSEMQLEKVSSELRRAIDAFEQGHVEAANAILDGIEREADLHMEQLELDRNLVHQDIEAFMLQAKTVIADLSIPINRRIEKAIALYAKADDWAEKSALNKEKYIDLLSDYANFLYDYAFYDKALVINHRLLSLCESFLGTEHPDTATSYNNIGLVYQEQGDYTKALEYLFKALAIKEKVLGMEHPDTATSYNNIGLVYDEQGDYTKALEYYFKALEILEIVLGTEHPSTATSYNNIGLVYDEQGDYTKALEYYFKALAIREKVLGTEHPNTATSYNNIGLVYDNQGDYAKALEYDFKALAIREKVLGTEHPSTATSYNNIGGVYKNQGDYAKALEYHFKALAIREKVLGIEHPSTANSYNNIGLVYYNKGDYDKALEYYFKALAICEKVLGTEHPNTKAIREDIDYIKSQIN